MAGPEPSGPSHLGVLPVIAYIRILAVAGVLVTVSACGGEADTTSSAQPGAQPSGAQPSGDQLAAFTDCLREHGVTMPSMAPRDRPSGAPSARPSRSAGGFPSMNPEMGKAMEACRSLMPSGGPGFGRGRDGGFDSSAFQAFASCMKDHGAELDENAGFRQLDESNPKIAKALKTCRPLMPTRAPRPSPTPAA